MQMSENQKLITVAETAVKLGVTSQTIRNYITSGAVKAVKIGNRTYIDKQALGSVLDQLSDVEGMSRNISRLKGRLAKEETALRTRLTGLEAPNSVLYFLNRVRYSKELMESVVYSLGYRHLTDRQLNIAMAFLRGDSPELIASRHGLTRSRIYEIVAKIIREIGKVPTYSSLEDTIDEKDKEIEILHSTIEGLRKEVESLRMESERKKEMGREFTDEDMEMLKLLNKPLDMFNISVRSLKCLHNADIDTIGDLVEYERTDLLKFRNFGKKSLNELDDVLESLNLEWGMDFTDLKNRYADYISKNKKYKTEVYDKA